MTVTYDLSHSDPTLKATSQVRLWTADTVTGKGPLPGGGNYSDDELAFFYNDEGKHVKRTVAAVLEALANAWAQHAGQYRLGPESEAHQQAEQYRAQAEKMRQRVGYATDSTADAQRGSFAISVKPAGQTS